MRRHLSYANVTATLALSWRSPGAWSTRPQRSVPRTSSAMRSRPPSSRRTRSRTESSQTARSEISSSPTGRSEIRSSLTLPSATRSSRTTRSSRRSSPSPSSSYRADRRLTGGDRRPRSVSAVRVAVDPAQGRDQRRLRLRGCDARLRRERTGSCQVFFDVRVDGQQTGGGQLSTASTTLEEVSGQIGAAPGAGPLEATPRELTVSVGSNGDCEPGSTIDSARFQILDFG